jgi:transposase
MDNKTKGNGEMSNKDIATIQHVSVIRIKQLWSQYTHTGVIPTLGKAGRPPRKCTRAGYGHHNTC